MKKETVFQNKVRATLCKEYGGICLRMNSGLFKPVDDPTRTVRIGIKGMSDLLYIGNGYIAWIELKEKPNKPTEDQVRFIEEMKKLGHRAGVAYTVEEALEIAAPSPKKTELHS